MKVINKKEQEAAIKQLYFLLHSVLMREYEENRPILPEIETLKKQWEILPIHKKQCVVCMDTGTNISFSKMIETVRELYASYSQSAPREVGRTYTQSSIFKDSANSQKGREIVARQNDLIKMISDWMGKLKTEYHF